MPPLYLPEQMNYHSPIKLQGEKLARKTFMQCNISANKIRYSDSKYIKSTTKHLCSSFEMTLFKFPAFQLIFAKDHSLIPNEGALMDGSLTQLHCLFSDYLSTNYCSAISQL